jgi:predicted RNA-binding Zn-ribbon protein involved in translation (DUF1610 family)
VPPDAPDWPRVNFPVPCVQCGEDLRGQSQPVCSHCGRRSSWQRILPVEHLRCPKCGYQLFGLTEQRCPECGEPFDWARVLDTARRRQSRLFEFLWFHNPLPAFAHSAGLAALRPRKLWAQYDLHARPQVLPLLAFILAQWVLFAYGWHVTAWVVDPIMNGIANWTSSHLQFVYRFRMGFDTLLILAIAYVLTFAAIQLLFQTKRRLGLRWPDTLRVYAHATVFMAFCPAAWCLLEALLDATLFIKRWLPAGPNSPPYLILPAAIFSIGLAVTIAHLAIGLHRHLNVPHAAAVATLCLVIGLLCGVGIVSCLPLYGI